MKVTLPSRTDLPFEQDKASATRNIQIERLFPSDEKKKKKGKERILSPGEIFVQWFVFLLRLFDLRLSRTDVPFGISQIDFTSSPNDLEQTETTGEELLHPIIQFCKDNVTSTFPFAFILIFKGFDEHSAGQFTLTLSLSLSLSLSRKLHADLLLGSSRSWKLPLSSSSFVQSESLPIITGDVSLHLVFDHRQNRSN